jgi:hypothetical protein
MKTDEQRNGRAMTKPINTAKFKDATGRDFEEWLAYLKTIDAESLSHKDIAAHLVDTAGVGGHSQSLSPMSSTWAADGQVNATMEPLRRMHRARSTAHRIGGFPSGAH